MRHDLLSRFDSSPVPARRRPILVRRRAVRERTVGPGFQRRFSCACWPLMVRLIWWLLRHDD